MVRRPKERVAAAIFASWWTAQIRPMAMLRRVAITRGPMPVRTWERSSWKRGRWRPARAE